MELPDQLLSQNFDIELLALAPAIFRRQLEGVSKFREKECYFHKLEGKKKNKNKKLARIFVDDMLTHLFYSCQIIFFVSNPGSFQGVILWKSPGLFYFKEQEGNFPLVQY